MKKFRTGGIAAIILLHSPRILAQEVTRQIGESESLISQVALEAQFSPFGAAVFEDVGRGWNSGVSFGLGFHHRYHPRPMVRNTIGSINRRPFLGGKIAKTDEVELVLIQPITVIFARTQSAELRPYFGWGFSLTILEDVSLRRGTRGYSAFVFETGLDVTEMKFLNIGCLRISVRALAGPEHGVIFVAFGTVLRPVPIFARLIN